MEFHWFAEYRTGDGRSGIKQYWLDKVGLPLRTRLRSGTETHEKGWTLCFTREAHGDGQRSGVSYYNSFMPFCLYIMVLMVRQKGGIPASSNQGLGSDYLWCVHS